MDTDRRGIFKDLGSLLALAALLYAIFIWRTAFQIGGRVFFTLVDDAMISMRYAQHLAHGFGPVWNIGQEPVQGFTNPGWMLLLTLLHFLPVPAGDVSLAVMILSAAILLANILVVYRLCEVLQPSSTVSRVMAAIVTALYFPLVFWSLRGMEVGLLALLIDAAALVAVQMRGDIKPRTALLLGLLLSLAVLVRLDALMQVLVVLGYLLLGRFSRQRLALPLTLVILTLLAVLLFQRFYYGDFLPNTYYQKMAGTSEWERLRYGMPAFYQHALWDTLLPAAVAFGCLLFYREFRRPEVLLLAALFAVQCGYSVWVGGDYAEVEVDSANRFITQGMPALIVLFSIAVGRLLEDPHIRLPRSTSLRRLIAVGISLLALAVISGRPWTAWMRNNAPLLPADIRRTRTGLFIARHTSPQAVIASHAAGQIPYYSERTTIDLLGLNDPVVARGPVTGPFYPGHDKWNYEYSIVQLRPDVIADNWIKLGPFMQDQPDYIHLENGLYVRRDSRLIDLAGLSQKYR